MSQRIVIDGENGWLNLRAATINWWEERGNGDPEGTVPVQLRWMIHQSIGLPLNHFQVWRMPKPNGTVTKQDLANNGDWELIETVGLPITDDWQDTNYSKDPQGLVSGPMPAAKSARDRLYRGAPRKGWLHLDGVPDWQRPNDDAYLELLVDGEIAHGLHQMLLDQPSPREHHSYVIEMNRPDPNELLPHLLLNDAVGSITEDDRPRGSWRPLSLMAMSASTDPLAALALGFGTALDGERGKAVLYMVTVRHELDLGSGNEFDIADIALPVPLYDSVPKPTNLATRLSKVTRPQVLDGPMLETASISWARPVKPPLGLFAPEIPFPVSYAIGRFGWPPIDILLTPRHPDVGGWLSYVPSLSSGDEPIAFQDHIYRTGNGTASGRPYPLDIDFTYVVAAQDIFGRWSEWENVAFKIPIEGPQGPSILSAELDNSGRLVVDFGWDWSDRSPQFIELSGAWTDQPNAAVASAHVDFAGQDQGQTAANIVPLSSTRVPCNWGSEQDKNEPGTRLYRWTATIALDFNVERWRDLGVRALGQQRLHHVEFGGSTTWNTSSWTAPVVARVWDDRPLDPPFVEPPEAPFWANLPDSAGISRFTLSWPSIPNAAGYLVYEATETALRSANNMEGPDTAGPHYVRLAALRNADITGKQRTFRRLTERPIAGTTYEIALPRGSKVIHFFAITTMNANGIEGHWPNNNQMFVAVAAPRLNPAPSPGIFVASGPNGPRQVAVTVELGGGANGPVEIYRTNIVEAAKEAGSMGPAITTVSTVGSKASYNDDNVKPGWLPQFYRAISWSARDNLLGLIEARSAPSQAVSILVPPPGPPDISYLAANEPYSTTTACLIAWNSLAPRQRTPVGPHVTVVEVRADENSPPRYRLERELDINIPSINAIEELPPGTEGIFSAAWIDGTYRAFVPRAENETFFLTVKMIDPLGRISRKTLNVNPLSPDQKWVTIPAWPDKEQVEQGDDMGMTILGAHELGLRVEYEFAQAEPGYEHEQVISISPPAGTIVAAGTTVTVLINLLG